MIGERLQRARIAKGLSLRALADSVGVSHNAIQKYEKNQMMPDSEVLLKISDCLSIRMDYLFRDSDVDLGQVAFRCKSNVPEKWKNSVKEKARDILERYIEIESYFPDTDSSSSEFPRIEIQTHVADSIESAANRLRNEWNLGQMPIAHILEFVEEKGVKIVFIKAPDQSKFDGLCGWIGDDHKIPVIVLDERWPADRIRFTTAHELGHLVLNDDDEKTANRFAGAFLYPKESVMRDFGVKRSKVDWFELAESKSRYGISMQGVMYRLFDLGVISGNYFRNLLITFKVKGWHNNEPRKLPPDMEKVSRMKRLLLRALQERIVSEAKAAELLQVPIAKLHGQLSLESS